MRIVLFCHSLLSDWNHGNAHFLRGLVTELAAHGHDVHAMEPRTAWSVENLVADHGPGPLAEVRVVYPDVAPVRYDLATLDLDAALDGADLVLVHEWNEPELVARIGAHRARGGRYRALFHDTHHRAVTAPDEMARFDLSAFDGVLVFGRALRDVYLARGISPNVWVWHEAADTRVFRPRAADARGEDGDVVWIGNWGDDERTRELEEFLIAPVRELGLRAKVHGVRYPREAREALREAGIAHGGWLPNYQAPAVYSRYRMTVHVPRRAYAEALVGIPTIRPFEAMACGIPLVSAPWTDAENLFAPGEDYLVARTRDEMKRHMRTLVAEPAYARALGERGRRRILERHTCAHRVQELVAIARELGTNVDQPQRAAS